jgi:hypothetical protein
VFGFLGPISSGNQDGIGPFGFALFGLFALFVVWDNFRGYLRRKQIHSVAESAGYAYLGDALPEDLLLGHSSLRNATTIANVFSGEARGKPVFFFEYTLGTGKGKIHRSVFAVCGPKDPFGAEGLDPTLVVECCGSWTLLYRQRGVFEPEEIQAFIAGL